LAHVVEHAQITHTLDNDLAGPDLAALFDRLRHCSHPYLAPAATRSERWLISLVGHVTTADATGLDGATERLLADVASYRHRWHVTDPTPLGDAAIDIDQANERAVLAIAIEQTSPTRVPDMADPDDLHAATHTPFRELDDALGR
jgi:hypothetical protein